MSRELFANSKEEYNKDYKAHFLEQYKIYLDSVRMTTTAGVIGAAPIGDSATPAIPNRRDQTSPLGGWARSRRGSLRLRLREIYPFRLKCRTVPPPRPRETGLSLQK